MDRSKFIRILKDSAQFTSGISPKVHLSELLETFEGSSSLPIIIGTNSDGDRLVSYLTRMPQLLIAGATGQGKTILIHDIIVTLLFSKTPEELQFVLIDPKMVEFGVYHPLKDSYLFKINGINEPIISDTDDAKTALESLCEEMDRRYALLNTAGVMNVTQFNERSASKLPYIVVIIDEYADLVMTLEKEIEKPIIRLAQKARTVGIHLILATQRPSTNIITGLIKANFPARIAFKVSYSIDSKVILDTDGAEKLLDRGDLIYSSENLVERVKAPFVDTPEISSLVNAIASSCNSLTKESINISNIDDRKSPQI